MILGHILQPGEPLLPGDRRLFEHETVPVQTPGLVRSSTPATEGRKRPLLSGEPFPSVDGGGVVTASHCLFFRPWTQEGVAPNPELEKQLRQSQKDLGDAQEGSFRAQRQLQVTEGRIVGLTHQVIALQAKLEVYEKLNLVPPVIQQMSPALPGFTPTPKEEVPCSAGDPIGEPGPTGPTGELPAAEHAP